jgi:hypothetical protein
MARDDVSQEPVIDVLRNFPWRQQAKAEPEATNA